MKKIVLTESQAKKLMTKVINEQSGGGRYSQDVKCNFDHHGLTHNGKEIEDITPLTISISFDIDQEHRSYGIKSINVGNIQGPSEMEIEVIQYNEESDDTTEDYVNIPIDWNNVEKETETQIDWIGIDNDVDIELANDENGGLIVSKIKIYVREL